MLPVSRPRTRSVRPGNCLPRRCRPPLRRTGGASEAGKMRDTPVSSVWGDAMATYRCGLCSYEYDPETEGVAWDDLPDDWVCPVCGSSKGSFSPVGVAEPTPPEPCPPGSVARVFRCGLCSYDYDEAAEGVPFAQLPHDWVCPVCSSSKDSFTAVAGSEKPVAAEPAGITLLGDR